jgi:hypothetical protein
MCSRKVIRYLGFSRRGVFIGEGHRQEWTEATSHIGGATRAWAAPPCCVGPLWPHSISSSILEALVKFWATGFGFVQFREYFLCNFSEAQKQQKTGSWHCGNLLIG